MTTTITQFTDKVDSGSSVSEGIGGTASAADWLQVTLVAEGGAYESGAQPSDNISGSSGWHKVAEYDGTGAGGSPATFRQDWVKQAVGGETTVTVTWTGTVTQGAILGFWAHTLTQPDLYVITQGIIPNGGFTATFVTPPGSVQTNNETYVGVMTAGGFVNSAQFTNICNTSGNGQNDQATVIGHYCDDEAAHSTADQPTYQMFTGRDGLYFVLYGFYTAPPEADLAGVGTLGLGATGALAAPAIDLFGVGTLGLGGSGLITEDSPTLLAGDGTLGLGAAGDLEVTGGELDVAGRGTLGLGGAGSLTAPDPVPPLPVPFFSNVLGCGVYEILVFTRGGGEILGNLEFDNFQWGRKLDATSASSITIDGVSNLGALQRCCALLGETDPWQNEVAIYRTVPGSSQKRRVWMGPITRMRFPNEAVIIESLDLSGWLQRRTLHENHNLVQVDLINMWVTYVEDAMSVDNSPGLYPHVLALSGILADRLTTINDHSYAADPIAELATTGIDWTVIDRVMQAGPVLPQPAFDAIDNLPLLLDESFQIAPEIIVDGMAMGNCWLVNGGGASVSGVPIFGEYGPAFDAQDDHVAQPAAPDYQALEDLYGRLEQVVSETRILDQPSIDKNAQTRYELTKRPVPYITGGALLPTAAIPMELIVPGALVRVKLIRACKPIDAVMRIESLDVSANADGSEDVNIGLEPIGTVTNG